MLAPLMAALETRYPPDVFGGIFGTSRRRVEQICRAYGVRLKELCGQPRLKTALGRRQPVIVMLGVSGGKLFGRDLPGGHWMVAYAYDAENVYLTNWGAMPWAEFRLRWNGLVPRLIQMQNRGLVAA